MMSCICGDLYCWFCGPAQGNFKCPNCGKWSEDGGCEDPATCEMANKATNDMADAIEAADAIEEAKVWRWTREMSLYRFKKKRIEEE